MQFLIFLILLGLLVASLLEYKERTNTKLSCLIKGHDCLSVIKSKYSKLFGLNNSLLGILYYISFAVGLFIINKNPNFIYIKEFLVSISILASLMSFYLLCVQIFKLKE